MIEEWSGTISTTVKEVSFIMSSIRVAETMAVLSRVAPSLIQVSAMSRCRATTFILARSSIATERTEVLLFVALGQATITLGFTGLYIEPKKALVKTVRQHFDPVIGHAVVALLIFVKQDHFNTMARIATAENIRLEQGVSMWVETVDFSMEVIGRQAADQNKFELREEIQASSSID